MSWPEPRAGPALSRDQGRAPWGSHPGSSMFLGILGFSMEQGHGASPKPLQRRGCPCLWELTPARASPRGTAVICQIPNRPLFSLQMFHCACALSRMEPGASQGAGPLHRGHEGAGNQLCQHRAAQQPLVWSCPSWGWAGSGEQEGTGAAPDFLGEAGPGWQQGEPRLVRGICFAGVKGRLWGGEVAMLEPDQDGLSFGLGPCCSFGCVREGMAAGVGGWLCHVQGGCTGTWGCVCV